MALVLTIDTERTKGYIGGLVQDCSNSSALAMELLQSCTNPPISNQLCDHWGMQILL